MCSKRLISLSMAIIIASTGCGLQVGEKPPERNPPAYSGNGFSCVGEIPQHIDKYVKNDLSVDQISTFVRCLQKAFTTFASLTRGRDAGTYTPVEIRRFLHEFFLGDRRISDSLLHEFMVIKQAMVGGSLTHISRSELQVAVEVLEELRTEALRLKPFIGVLNPNLAKLDPEPETVGQRLRQADEALKASIQTIAARLRKGNREYPLTNMRTFLMEFRNFVGWERHFQQTIHVDNWVNFIETFRNLTVAPREGATPKGPLAREVHAKDWEPMLQEFRRWYMVYLQYQVGVKDRTILSGRGLKNVVRLGKDVQELLEDTVARHHNGEVDGEISFQKIDGLILALERIEWLPGKLSAQAVSNAVKHFVTRALGNPDTKPSERRASGLDVGAVANARVLFTEWSTNQVRLANRFNLLEAEEDQQESKTPDLTSKVSLIPRDIRRTLRDAGSSSFEELMKATKYLERPLFPNGKRYVAIAPKKQLDKMNTFAESFTNLSMINIWRMAVKVIFRSYADQVGGRSDWESGITAEELEKFYVDFRDIGIGLGLVDQRNDEVGLRAFTEAKIFTYSAKGFRHGCTGPLARMSMAETIELFMFLYSGSNISDTIYNELTGLGQENLPKHERIKLCDIEHKDDDGRPIKDAHGRPVADRKCVSHHLPILLNTHLKNMPEFQQFLTLSQGPQRQKYADTVLNMAKIPGVSSNDWVELSELNMLVVVLHYLEAIMTRYDVNVDGILNAAEIVEAEKTFPGYFEKFHFDETGKELGNSLAKGVLYYLLTYRKLPPDRKELGLWAGLLDDYYVWSLTDGVQQLSITRADLVDIMNVIIPKIFDSKAKRAKKKQREEEERLQAERRRVLGPPGQIEVKVESLIKPKAPLPVCQPAS